MRKRLIFLMMLCLFLTGCGGAAPEASPEVATAPGAMLDAVEETDAPAQSVTEQETAAPAACETKDPTEDCETVPAAGETAPSASGTNYFVFTRANSVTTGDDGTELLYEYSCDTAFTSWDQETEAWVDGILEQIQKEYTSNSSNLLQFAQEHLDEIGEEYFYGFSNYQEVGASRHDTRIVSLIVLSSVYSGGAHPNSVQTAWNLDMEQKQLLTLEDVIYPESAATLGDMVKQKIDDAFQPLGEGALFPDYGETVASAFSGESMTPYWYFNDQGLVIFFNQYELGPYAAGIIKTAFLYEELEGILREEFFPRYYTQIPGDMLLRGDWDGYRRIPITVESDGEQILIGVEGEIFQVQLSEVSWLEGTAIGQRMLFSADRMTQNDVLELIGGYDDETRSFAVEFIDGQGNVTIYYIHPDGLSLDP